MASETITLSQGRCIVAAALDVPPLPWSADEVRWIAGEWTTFSYELLLCRLLKDDLMELERGSYPWLSRCAIDVWGGVAWWVWESPAFARAIVGTLFAFAVAFVWGWL